MSWRKWVVGLVVQGVIGGVFLPIYSVVQECGPSRDRQSEAAAQGLRNSINQFHLQYGSFSYLGPDVTAKGELELSSDGPTLAILLGLNEERNPRKIAFGEWREAGKTRKNGIVYSSNGEMWGLVDQWGNRFRMVIDLDSDHQLTNPDNTSEVKILRQTILVYSAGPDGDYSSWEDNVKTW